MDAFAPPTSNRPAAARGIRFCLMVAAACFLRLSAQPAPAELRYKPEDIIAAGRCGTCHERELKSWQNSHHYSTYKTLPESELAEDIADKLDIFDITEEGKCLQCHFTMRKASPTSPPKALSGVSCELCHGAGREWYNVHSDLGEYTNNPDEEPPEHREARLKAAQAKGMRDLTDLYTFGRSCFECHTVPEERIVNLTAHEAGSPFEFVAWSQGEVRHNFLANPVVNTQRPREHLHIMYIVGRLLDLEFGLRGVAQATKDGRYAQAMAARTLRARNHVVDIILPSERLRKDRVNIPELEAIVKAVPAKFSYGEREGYMALAEHVGSLTRKMLENEKEYVSEFKKVDRLVPLSNAYKGEVFSN